MTESTVAADQLKGFVRRIQNLQEQKQEIADDIKDVYAEAKSQGFDVKALRRVMAFLKDPAQQTETMTVFQTYLNALGISGGGLLDPARLEASATKEGE